MGVVTGESKTAPALDCAGARQRALTTLAGSNVVNYISLDNGPSANQSDDFRAYALAGLFQGF